MSDPRQEFLVRLMNEVTDRISSIQEALDVKHIEFKSVCTNKRTKTNIFVEIKARYVSDKEKHEIEYVDYPLQKLMIDANKDPSVETDIINSSFKKKKR